MSGTFTHIAMVNAICRQREGRIKLKRSPIFKGAFGSKLKYVELGAISPDMPLFTKGDVK